MNVAPADPAKTAAESDPLMSARRLVPGDRTIARETFSLMAAVFQVEASPLSEEYIDGLLARPGFWAITAFCGDALAGGLTAHTIPMTVYQGSDVLLYDIAVRADLQRQGIGRRLVEVLRQGCSEIGIETVFVLADDEDTHALDFYRALLGSPSRVTMFELASGRAAAAQRGDSRFPDSNSLARPLSDAPG